MTTFLPKEVQAGLDAARKRDQRRNARMMVEADGKTYRILKFWDTGFELDAENAPHLRGFVDILDKGEHLYQALIIASAEETGRMVYEFKRMTEIANKPPRDFADDKPVVTGLIGLDTASKA